MSQSKVNSPRQPPIKTTVITVRPRNQSPKAQTSLEMQQSSGNNSEQLSNVQEPYNNPSNQSACEVRVRCCKNIMKCSGYTLIAALVVTTAGIAYYLRSLAGSCSELIAPITQIRDYAGQGIGLVQQGLILANQSLAYVKAEGPELESLLNVTRNTCQSVSATCQEAQRACDHPF